MGTFLKKVFQLDSNLNTPSSLSLSLSLSLSNILSDLNISTVGNSQTKISEEQEVDADAF